MSELPPAPPLFQRSVAEAIGTFILVLFGLGSVHAAVLVGAQQGLWQVAIVWALGVMLAIYVVGHVSGAHLNPAMTLAFALWRQFPWLQVPCYVFAQTLGAFTAAALLFFLWQPYLHEKEVIKNVGRGEPGSIVTAMCYGEYFPNPGGLAAGDATVSAEDLELRTSMVSAKTAFIAELIGTMLLAMVVFAVTDPRNAGRPSSNLAPVFIGLAVAGLISVIAPLTQACFNPARDFGPRLFAAMFGWGDVALPWLKNWDWLTVYIVAPCLGAGLGGLIYDSLLRRVQPPAPGTAS